jgi:hypothetical protein
VNPTTGVRTDVVAGGGRLTIDPSSKSFIVAVPRSLLPVSGTWRVRLGAGLADTTRQSVAPPYVGNPSSSPSPSAERVYNITFRAVAQEPPIFTSGTTAAQIAAIQALLAGTPLGAVLGLDGLARGTTGNFWMESDQADTLAGGNVSAFSRLVDWSQLAARTTTPEPQPTGYSVRWYVSRLNLGFGQVVNDGNNGNFQPTLLERLQPYAVYVPTTYRPGKRASLTWILHSYEVSYNQYGLLDPQLIQQLCQSRSSICATTEGLGPSGWYYNGAETDFWQVWRSLAQAFSLDATRTVSTGYSMGGWASYKLVFEHPDDFAGALSLDGPVVCGIQGFPGANFPAYQDPACSKDGQSQPLIANARWVPYVIDHTYADELVPVTGVIAQAQTFDRLGQRYDLFIHTGGDHLAFAVEDRFGGAVAALGLPGLKTNPDTFGYSWYPSLKSALFGIGATGDYWLHDLRAGDTAFGVIASVQAHDAALPDPTVTDQRFGPSLVTQPLPGTETGLRWKLGTRPKPRKTMTLRLTDVVGLSLDAAAAKLKTGTITIFTDRGTRFEIKNLARGTQVLERGHRVAAANRHGVVSVNLHSGKTVLMLVAAAATHPAPPPRQRPAPAPSFTG